MSSDLLAGRDAYDRHKKSFLASWNERNQKHTLAMKLNVFGHVMFPKTHEAKTYGY